MIYGRIDLTNEGPDTAFGAGLNSLEPIETGSGGDLVKGFAEGDAAGGSTLISGIGNGALLDLGGGRNAVIGKAVGEQTSTDPSVRLSVAGIGQGQIFDAPGHVTAESGTIQSGEGRDSILGHAALSGGSDVQLAGAGGIVDQEIDTGGGHDRLAGTAKASVGDDSLVGALGIAFAEISTGGGRDKVSGHGEVVGGNRLSDQDPEFSSIGILDAGIETGEGDDRVVGKASIEAGVDALVSGAAIQDTFVFTGEGRDKVIARLKIEVGVGAETFDQAAMIDVLMDTGAGDDLVKAITSIEAPDAVLEG